jgi:flagellar L-ring protein precursor FlgH
MNPRLLNPCRALRRSVMVQLVFLALMLAAPAVHGQHDSGPSSDSAAPSNSALARALREGDIPANPKDPHALRDSSLFAVAPPKPREFALHDLIQIVVHESSTARSEQTLETEKDWNMGAKISKWPNFQLSDLIDMQLTPSAMAAGAPELDISADREFNGEGEYERRDDFSARITAEVIEILPNGNLILEARTTIRMDEEIQNMKVTGVCRPLDVSPANTVLSNQLHDLVIDRAHEGELKRTNEKGIITRIFEALFAF